MTLRCAGCWTASEDRYKPCGCTTMVGIDDDGRSHVFRDPNTRDALAKIICRYLTGKDVAADGVHANWLCPTDDESANAMCREIAEEILHE